MARKRVALSLVIGVMAAAALAGAVGIGYVLKGDGGSSPPASALSRSEGQPPQAPTDITTRKLSSPQQQGDLPTGWKTFNDGGYTGGVRQDWVVSSLPDGSIVIFMDFDMDFPTTYIILKACSGTLTEGVLAYLGNPDRLASDGGLYGGATAQSIGVIRNGERQLPFIKLDIGRNDFESGYAGDTYKVLFIGRSCYAFATLNTRPEDNGATESFRTFISLLQQIQ